ncbi:MAG: hypothetical protein U5K72_15950 [Balneolaceae bacterium]|nr:hypothetical protein [Balneolaceae bacterium]
MNEELTKLISQQEKNREKFDRLNPLERGNPTNGSQKSRSYKQTKMSGKPGTWRSVKSGRFLKIRLRTVNLNCDSLNKQIQKLEEEQKQALEQAQSATAKAADQTN